MVKDNHRTYFGLIWEAKSPAHYVLVGYPGIQARFDGKEWSLNQIDSVKFPSMVVLSEVVTSVCESYSLRGNRW
jgi:hypothetical protein